MKKTFPLQREGRHPDRVVDAVKHEIRKYFQRERRRSLPVGADLWVFDCRFGPTEATAEVVQEAAITQCINAVVAQGGSQFYIEILARAAQRSPRTARAPDGAHGNLAEHGPGDAD